MPFLNIILLWGMIAVSLPVIIHLLNRRKARVIDWGAMQFLEMSLATRGRRILLEELILLLLRTLLLAALVFALARPLLRNEFYAGSAGANQDVVIVLDGSMSMAMSPPASDAGREEDTGTRGHGDTGTNPSGGSGLVPASPRPGVPASSYFDLAKDAAEQAVDQLAPGDAVAVLLAGSSLRSLTEGLTFDRESAKRAIRQARVTDGSMSVPTVLGQAAAVLAAGGNYHKQTLFITDGRAFAWRIAATEDWQTLAGRLNAIKTPSRIQVLCLAQREEKNRPDWPTNLAIEAVRLSRPVIGTDMPVMLMADVRNTGRSVAGENVNLGVRVVEPGAGAEADTGTRGHGDTEKKATGVVAGPSSPMASTKKALVGKLAPLAADASRPVLGPEGGAADQSSGATVQLEVKFEKPGAYRLLFDLDTPDALAADNRLAYAVQVLDSLPVLLVNGDPSATREADGCFWLKAAFQPSKVDRADLPIEFLIAPTVIDADRLADEDLERYSAVVLADVAALPPASVDKLKEFVSTGGGLLVAPGEKVEAGGRELYNSTLFEDGRGLLPATLGEPVDVVQPGHGGTGFQPVNSQVGNLGHRPSARPPGPASQIDGQPAVGDNSGEESTAPVIALSPPVRGHPAFVRTDKPEMWDPIRIHRRFPLTPARDQKVATVLRLSQGLPSRLGGAADPAGDEGTGSLYAAEKQFGRGRVIELGGPLNVQWSNMLLHPSPIPAINELMYYLSAPRRTVLNVPAGQKLIAPSSDIRAVAQVVRPGAPPGQSDPAPTVERDGRLQFEYGPVAEPGVYEMRLPGGEQDPGTRGHGDTGTASGRIVPASQRLGVPASPSPALLYFTVQRDPGESLTTLLTNNPTDPDCDCAKVAGWLNGKDDAWAAGAGGSRIQFHDELGAMLKSERVRDPGREIWKWVAAGVLAMLLLEIWLSGWITRRRGGGTTDQGPGPAGEGRVSFGNIAEKTVH